MPAEFISAPRAGAEASPIIHDRITVVEMIYHRPALGGEVFLSEARFNRELQTFEQVYERRHVMVGEDWQKLSFGWVKAVGMLVILNEEGQFLRVYPTEQEREALKHRVLEVSYGPPDSKTAWLIYPGETIRTIPSADPENLHIRCREGRASYTVRAFPA